MTTTTTNKLFPGTPFNRYYTVRDLRHNAAQVPRLLKWKPSVKGQKDQHTDIHIIQSTENESFLGYYGKYHCYQEIAYIGYAIIFDSLDSAQACIDQNIKVYNESVDDDKQVEGGKWIPVSYKEIKTEIHGKKTIQKRLAVFAS